jgi:hypothetical protein
MTTGMGEGIDPRAAERFMDMVRQATHCGPGQRIEFFIMDGVMYHVERGPCDCDGVPLPEEMAMVAMDDLVDRLGWMRNRETPRCFEISHIPPMHVSDGGDDGKWKPPGGYPHGRRRRW